MSNNFVDRLVMCCWTAISNRLFQIHNKYRFNYNPSKWNQETINIDIITEEKFPRTCVLQKMCFAFKNTKIQDLLYFKKCLYATTHFFIVWICFSIFNMNTANKKQQSSVTLKTGIFGPAWHRIPLYLREANKSKIDMDFLRSKNVVREESG